eukprot:TRINITY_DN25_c0_g2_i2.p2 TRINITY_DN25_c0_g2~~TRINITY_DN25_c0_g2_i2.p2  ORF type:complete len:263 (-),score=61.87 TRINITY_DN25_c0_g2_i2:1191-1979(-)
MSVDQQTAEVHLKYLDFFRLIVLSATNYVAAIYEYAKENSGPLKPGVDSVEGTVKTVVGPVYKQFHSKPAEFLQFIDSKVDGALALLGEVVPQFLKDSSHAAYNLASQASEAAATVVTEVKEQGAVETARSYYDKYEPVAKDLSIQAYQLFLTVPFAPQLVSFVTPAALFGADKLNGVVLTLKKHHLPLSEYIPLLPVEGVKEKGINETPNGTGTEGAETTTDYSAGEQEPTDQEQTETAPSQEPTATEEETPSSVESSVAS